MASKQRLLLLQQVIFVFLLVLSFVHSKCKFGGKTFESYRVVYKLYNEEHDWCFVGLCKDDGQIWKLVDLSCGKKSRTETRKTITTPLQTAEPGARCIYEGKEYSPSSEIFRGFDELKGVCYTIMCTMKGEVVTRDRRRCKTTEQPVAELTTIPVVKVENRAYSTRRPDLGRVDNKEIETTTPFSMELITNAPQTQPIATKEPSAEVTTPFGCFVDGKFFPQGSKISEGYDEHSDWCYGQYCGKDGIVISWDKWNCKRGEVTITTPPMDHTTLPPHGCYDNGVLYRPGEAMSQGYDESSDWCYGTYCDENSLIVSWDTWNCRKRTTYPPTTLPMTMTMARKCKYGSSLYNDGDKVYERYDKQNNWCYGLFCSNEGQLVYWDKWNCNKVATPSVPLPQKGVKTDVGSSAGDKTPVRCLYKGTEYLSRQVIKKDCTNGNRCKVLFCNHSGIVVPKLLKDISRKE